MIKLFFILIFFQIPLLADTPFISVYTANWLSPNQLYSIVLPSKGDDVSIFVLDTTNQLILSGPKEKVSKIISDLRSADHKSGNDPSVQNILDTKIKISGSLKKNDNTVMTIDDTILCGHTFNKDDFEKICYHIGRIRKEDRYVTLGEKISITPYVKPGELYIDIVFTQKKIIGWDKNAFPIVRENNIKKQFRVENNKKSVYYLIKNNKARVTLHLFTRLEDILE